ncbi:fused FliR family export protein/FlhB family type III secretion system protein [uncultured Clostridium sp.]|uniref:fused FliR family export protein/FlhB family type III secretion system protein n=1 Tax=uncultured Clostridium sp. TaxID=59620 RepID=UPI0028ED6F8E|nr:fused FliR family export protein/FlhB family type III secretion system protein [uncultured Clostridium sp.]
MINVAFYTALIMVFLRFIAFFTVTPVFFPKGTPAMVKIGFVLILSFVILPGIDYSSVNTINDIFPFIASGINEIITGLTLGYITEICFMSVRMAGNFIDVQVGFSMMSMLDPNTNTNSTLLERLLYWCSLVMFFILDVHHVLIYQLVGSYKSISIGKSLLSDSLSGLVTKIFIDFFSLGLKIAIPVVLIIIITELTLGLMARTVPQLNIMILGLPVKILVGLTTFTFALPIFITLIKSSFIKIPELFQSIFNTIPFIFIFASDDKTEDATPHKLSEAKKKGQVAKSKDVNLALTLLISTLVLSFAGEYVVGNLKGVMTTFLNEFLNMELNYQTLGNILIIILGKLALTILPIVVPIMIMGIFANFIQTGFILTKEPLKPDIKKLNPINGFKKMFSMRSVVELIKAVLVVTIVGVVGYKFIKNNYIYIVNLYNLRYPVLMEAFGDLALKIFFKVTLVMAAIALSDFTFQKFQFKKEMKMTKQEVKEEFKQMEGDPQIKGKIRQKQREMAMRRMMQAVPDATVVITNPTHISVAIRYKEGENKAPVLVAKGTDFVALKIKEKAKESNVPIIENKPLARLIYNEVELDSEIPVEMYQAVAEVLAIVMKMK